MCNAIFRIVFATRTKHKCRCLKVYPPLAYTRPQKASMWVTRIQGYCNRHHQLFQFLVNKIVKTDIKVIKMITIFWWNFLTFASSTKQVRAGGPGSIVPLIVGAADHPPLQLSSRSRLLWSWSSSKGDDEEVINFSIRSIIKMFMLVVWFVV